METARKYYLTDGHTVAKSRVMAPDEAQQANLAAEEATDGTWWWGLKAPEFDQRVLDGGGYSLTLDDQEITKAL